MFCSIIKRIVGAVISNWPKHYCWRQFCDTWLWKSSEWCSRSANSQYFYMIQNEKVIYTFWRIQKFWLGVQKFLRGRQNILRSSDAYFAILKQIYGWKKTQDEAKLTSKSIFTIGVAQNKLATTLIHSFEIPTSQGSCIIPILDNHERSIFCYY